MYTYVEHLTLEIKEMHAYFVKAPSLPDPLMNAPHWLTTASLTIGSTRVFDGARNAITRNAKLRRQARRFQEKSSEWIDIDLTIGHHLVTNLEELLERIQRRTIKIVYPYFATMYMKMSDDKLIALIDKYADSPIIRCFDIPSIVAGMSPAVFARYPVFRECPLRSTMSTVDMCCFDWDTDAIDEMLDRDGWTPEHLEFVNAVLMTGQHSGFALYLGCRGDCRM